MMRYLTTAAMLVSFAGVPMMVGCDRTVSESKTTKTNSDGSSSTDMSKTTQSPDGSTQTKTDHSVNK